MSSGEELVIRLDDVGGAIAVCALDGVVLGCSPSGRELLGRIGVGIETTPVPLPDTLWQLICHRPLGEALQYRSPLHFEQLFGLTRYSLGPDRWLLVMGEITEKQRILVQRLHKQRLEAVGRLVATTVHDLRSPLASI